MTRLSSEDHHIEGPNAFDFINNSVVNGYDQAYYNENEGLYIDFSQEM